VDVPNYSKAGLTMSPVAVASAFTDKAPTISDTAAVPALVPGLMTATRTFDRADTLSVATVVRGGVPAASDLTWRVIDEAGAEVFRSAEPGASAFDSESRRHVTRIPLDRLGSGQYQLIVEARSTSPDHRAQRTVIFSIR
jgi:hypothetical protein